MPEEETKVAKADSEKASLPQEKLETEPTFEVAQKIQHDVAAVAQQEQPETETEPGSDQSNKMMEQDAEMGIPQDKSENKLASDQAQK